MAETGKTRPPTVVTKQDTLPIDGPRAGKPVDINGDITPISRQKVSAVDATAWQDQSVSELHEQLHTLEQRAMYARQHGNYAIVTQIERGINELRQLIHQKTPDELKLI